MAAMESGNGPMTEGGDPGPMTEGGDPGSTTEGGDFGSGPPLAEVVGISIAAVLGFVLLLFCCSVFLVFLVKRHKVKRTGRMPIDIPGEYSYKGRREPLEGISNAMYASKFSYSLGGGG